MQTLVLILELIGTVAFAVSGAMTALKKHMDVFGVAILGVVTAVGGGALRDIVLGITPPTMFIKPVYAGVAVVVSLVAFLPWVRKYLLENHRFYEIIMRVMDSLGLAIFTVMGIDRAYSLNGDYKFFLLVFVGVITGVGGGLMRDIMAGNTPYIFVKHIYACASLMGAVVCVALLKPLGEMSAMIIGAVLIFAIRLLAAHFKWSLPRAK